MNRTQRIIVWGMAAALSVVSIWYGLASAWSTRIRIAGTIDRTGSGFRFLPEHLIPLLAIPIILIGVAAILHARGKKPPWTPWGPSRGSDG